MPVTQKSEGIQTSIWEQKHSPSVFVQLVLNAHRRDKRPCVAGQSGTALLGGHGAGLGGRTNSWNMGVDMACCSEISACIV